MPRTIQTAPAIGEAAVILVLLICRLFFSVADDLRELAGIDHRVRRARRLAQVRAKILRRSIYVPTRAETFTFLLMFSLGANLVTVLAIAARA